MPLSETIGRLHTLAADAECIADAMVLHQHANSHQPALHSHLHRAERVLRDFRGTVDHLFATAPADALTGIRI